MVELVIKILFFVHSVQNAKNRRRVADSNKFLMKRLKKPAVNILFKDDRMTSAIVKDENNLEQLPPREYAGVYTKDDLPIPGTNADTKP